MDSGKQVRCVASRALGAVKDCGDGRKRKSVCIFECAHAVSTYPHTNRSAPILPGAGVGQHECTQHSESDCRHLPHWIRAQHASTGTALVSTQQQAVHFPLRHSGTAQDACVWSSCLPVPSAPHPLQPASATRLGPPPGVGGTPPTGHRAPTYPRKSLSEQVRLLPAMTATPGSRDQTESQSAGYRVAGHAPLHTCHSHLSTPRLSLDCACAGVPMIRRGGVNVLCPCKL